MVVLKEKYHNSLSGSLGGVMLEKTDLERYHELGIIKLEPGLGPQAARYLLDQVPQGGDLPLGTVFEDDGVTVRALHGGHRTIPAFRRLTELDILLGTVEQLLGSQAYVYQFKVNLKAAFTGAQWPWHDDYAAWRIEDGMPTPNALTAAIFLDEVTQFNGPLFFVPRSHLAYAESDIHEPERTTSGWAVNFGATLRYQAPPSHLETLVAKNGIVAPTGPPGTVLIFDSRILHASPPNITPLHRRIAFISYNSVTNTPLTPTRPEFLVDRDSTPLRRLPDAALFNDAAQA